MFCPALCHFAVCGVFFHVGVNLFGLLPALTMPANHNTHNFKVQHKKPEYLIWPKLPHELVGPRWHWWIMFVFVPFGD